MTLYLEDLSPGRQFVSAGRTVTEADIVNFAGLSGDYNQLHTNEEWVAEHTDFDGRIAHGLLVLAISNGLTTPGLDDLEILAFLETSRKMKAPTYPGDTIYATTTVEDARASSSRPGSGISTLKVEVHNQRGELVQVGTDVLMVASRAASDNGRATEQVG